VQPTAKALMFKSKSHRLNLSMFGQRIQFKKRLLKRLPLQRQNMQAIKLTTRPIIYFQRVLIIKLQKT